MSPKLLAAVLVLIVVLVLVNAVLTQNQAAGRAATKANMKVVQGGASA